MAARGYDDTVRIAEIDALMRANPSMSRKAAIRQVAGEPNLRRIEAKMMKRDADGQSDAEIEDILIPMRLTATQALLVGAEERLLAGSGERVRWSGFNDLATLAELRRRREIPLPLPIRICFSAIVLGSIAIMASPIFDHRIELTEAIGAQGLFLMVGTVLVLTVAMGCILCGAYNAAFGPGEPSGLSASYDSASSRPVVDTDSRRFILTDRAFYALTPDGRDVRIRRYASSMAAELFRTPDGQPEIMFGTEKVCLEAVPGVNTLLTRIGLPEEDRPQADGVAVLG